MKKFIALAGIMAVCLLPVLSASRSADDITGFWVTEGKDTMVEIYKKDGMYFGRIVSLKYPSFTEGAMKGKPRTDTMNPDESKRSRPWLGMELLSGFRYESGKWTGGEIYDPEGGDTYSCEITLAADGTLDVRGYLGINLIGRTTKWERRDAYMKREMKFLGLDCDCAGGK